MSFQEPTPVRGWRLDKVVLMTTFVLIRFFLKKYKNIVVLLSTALLLCIFSIIIFQQFLKMSGEELIESWLKAESTTLQQGNLLSAVSRAQGLVLAGNLVTEIQLKKIENEKWINLIDFGNIKASWQKTPDIPGKIQWTRIGFFSWAANYTFLTGDSTTIQFIFYSARLVLVFWIYLGIISLFVFISALLITKIERQNSIEREIILRKAIENLISDKLVPDILKLKVPKLVEHWQSFKNLLDRHKEQETKARAAILAANIAKQVAHDIRSPISVLNLILRSLTASDENKAQINTALKRINDIANNLLVPQDKKIEKIENQNQILVMPNQKVFILIKPVIRSIVAEKKIEFQNKNIEFLFKDDEDFDAYTSLTTEILSRVLSNALNNSVDAIDNVGKITISIRGYSKYNYIVIIDNGKGIPKDILPKIGTSGITYGKQNGNGIGLHFIKSSIEEIGGSVDIQSRENFGTMLTLKIPSS